MNLWLYPWTIGKMALNLSCVHNGEPFQDMSKMEGETAGENVASLVLSLLHQPESLWIDQGPIVRKW